MNFLANRCAITKFNHTVICGILVRVLKFCKIPSNIFMKPLMDVIIYEIIAKCIYPSSLCSRNGIFACLRDVDTG